MRAPAPPPRQRPAATTLEAPTTEWIARFAQAVVEVLAGERPASYLAAWVSPALLDAFRAQHQGLRLRGSKVHSLRTQRIHDAAIEVCVVLHGARRSHAVALRLQQQRSRWRCTTLLIV